MQRYFLDNNEDFIVGEDYFHIKQVMRMKPQDEIEVCKKDGCYLVQISEISDKVYFHIIKPLNANQPLIHITLIQGLGKSDKQEIVCKYATQFGVSEIIFVPMQRSIAKYDDKSIDKKMDRLKKIALEAARLAHRDEVPEVTYLEDIKKIKNNFDHRFIAYENTKETTFLDKVLKLRHHERIALVIGPEGGIDEKELSYLKTQGFTTVGLGNRVLQTEIASLYALSVIDAFMQTINS
ncbi:MAG: hypothetical protein CVV63_03275 [Tenericutes bacterium HGW-Tenericutes-8]|nr:MAG: hypothetical protein CVV63_03275 [Tenericutes bacterium HGW-Tenericutes-8]